ncbi:MAG: hypothetical protein WEG56_12235 [Chloroflexota bacterium]
MIATEDALLTYFADLVDEIERFAITVLPPNDADEISVGRDHDHALVIDLECRPPLSRRSADVHMEIFERWRPTGGDHYERVDYKFELRHDELQYRRAFHRHDVERFVGAFDVATHEHCEATIGVERCRHYFGEPVVDARDGFMRLYELWLSDEKPDCSALLCLG